MRDKQHLMRQLENYASQPLQPILELCGDRRIWIENHRGVLEYTHERIVIAVLYGRITICGTGLRLARMQGHMLAIAGNICSILLDKG